MYSATSSGRLKRSFSAFLLEDGDLRFQVRRWISAIKPHSNRERRRSSIELMSFGRQSGRNHDLLLLLIQGVEGMEELFLGRSLPAMNWISSTQQHISMWNLSRKLIMRQNAAKLMTSMVNFSALT